MGTRSHPVAPNHAFLITAVTYNRRPLFREPGAATKLLEEIDRLREELHFALLAYAVMPDHIHLIIVPADASLAKTMQMIKGRFARLWNSSRQDEGPVWQARYYESAVRTEAQLRRWIEYIDLNRVKAGLADSPESYAFSSAAGSVTTDLDSYLSGLWHQPAAAAGGSAGQPKVWPSADGRPSAAEEIPDEGQRQAEGRTRGGKR